MPGKYDHFIDIPHPVHGTKANINPITKLPDVPEPNVSRMAALNSGLVLNNPISGAIDRGRVFAPTFEPDPGYIASDDPALKNQDIMNFVGSRSAEESQWMLQEVERNLIHQKLSSYPGGGWGMMIGIMGDPTIMFPAIATGGSSMAVAAAADVTGEVVRETILHSQQPLRTKLETAFNIATVGIVDAALWRLSKSSAKRAELAEIRKAAVKYMSDPKSPIKLETPIGEQVKVPSDADIKGMNLYNRIDYLEELQDEEFIAHFTKKELQTVADELGVPRSGNKTQIADRIRTARWENLAPERDAKMLPVRKLVAHDIAAKAHRKAALAIRELAQDMPYNERSVDIVYEAVGDANEKSTIIRKEDPVEVVNSEGEKISDMPIKGAFDEEADIIARRTDPIEGDFEDVISLEDTDTWLRLADAHDEAANAHNKVAKATSTKHRADEAMKNQLSRVGEDVVPGFAPGMGLSPGGRIMKSASDTAKRTLQLLVDVPYRFVKTEILGEAVPASIEAKIKKGFGDFASMTDIFAEQFRAYRKARGPWSVDEFLLEVHRQMETGVRGSDPYVNRVTDYFKKFDDAYFSAEQALGVAGRRRRGGHVMRIYNDSKIKANKTGLSRVIASNLRRIVHTPGYKRLIGYSDGTFEVVNHRYVQDALEVDPHAKLINMNDLDSWEFDSIADEMVGSLQMRTMVDDIDPDLVVVDPTSAKSRMLDFVPTRELEPWLETNALSIMGIRSRQHYRSQATREAFPDDPSMVTTFERIAEEYQALRDAATDSKVIDDLVKEERETLQTLKALRDSVHGVYGVPDNPYSGLVRTGRWLRLGALTGYGANIASTSLTDFLTPALRNGLEPFRHGLTVLFKKAVRKEYLAQIRKMGVAVESVTNNKAAMLINMSHVTKGEQKFMKYYGKYSGLDWVTDTSQGLNAMSHLQTWKKWADNWDNISPTKKKRLLDVGVDDDMIKRIKEQWDTHGDVVDGIRLPTTDAWVDKVAADALENAVRKETFLTTLVPGKGDIPLWMQTEPGKFAGMFMSFISGANQRLLVAGFQRSDAAFYTGILVSAAAGMLVQAGKDLARGKDMTERDPIEYMVDSIDKTGLFGWFSVPIQPLSSLAAGRPFEFTWRNLSDQMFSPPPIEWAGDVAVPMGNILTGNGENQDYIDMMKVTPMVNALHFVDLSQRLIEYNEDF